MPESLVGEEGKKVQASVWKQIAAKLEEIEPGCVERAASGSPVSI